MAAETSFVTHRISTSDGLQMQVRDYAPGCAGPEAETPILALPGLARNAKDFHRLARHLQPRRRIVSVDWRGRGGSDWDPNPENYHPRTYVDDIRQVMIVLGLHEVVIIGTSMGGLVAMGLALAVPIAIKGIVLNDVGPEFGAVGMGRIMDYLSTRHVYDDWPTVIEHLQGRFTELSLETDEEWRDFAEATFREGPDGKLVTDWDPTILAPIKKMGGEIPDLWPYFGAITPFPVLAIRGGLSKVLGEETFKTMAERHPDFTAFTLPNVGHAPTLYEPPCLEVIDEFLARVG